jgi:putative glutamine amidotransferase
VQHVVAVTTDRRPRGPAPSGPRVRPPRPEFFVGEAVVRALRRASLLPILLPPGEDPAAPLAAWALDRVDGVVITGGAFDIHPHHYGAEVRGRIDAVDERRTALELLLARGCLHHGLPVLGICGGMQALAVAAGGSLVQDIATERSGALEHEQPTDPAEPWHPVHLEGGPLREAIRGDLLRVNSTHHQAVAEPGALVVSGWAPDGVVEAVHHPRLPFAVGVQWHPELLEVAETFAIFGAFAAAVRAGLPG